MSDKNEVITQLEDRLRNNLAVVDYNGPQRVLGGEIVSLLVEMLINVLDGCFGASGSIVPAKKALGAKLNFFQRIKLKSELRDQVYEGSRRLYRVYDGDKVYECLLKTVNESNEEEHEALLGYVEENARDFTPTDFGNL